MTVELALVISIVSVAFSVFFGLKNNKRSDTKEIEERVKENTRINMKLDNISSSTQDIKEQISSLVRDVQKHGDRLVKVEEGVKRNDEALKRLHDRVDNVEDRMNKEDK